MKPHNSALRRGALVAVILAATIVTFTSLSLTVKAESNNSKQTKSAQIEESHHQLGSGSKQQQQQSQSQSDNHQKDHHQAVAQTPDSSSSLSQPQPQPQPSAEKKQGDAALSSSAPSSSSTQDLFGGEEYVQIKPEEITVNENGKEEYTNGQQQTASQNSDSVAQQQQVAEHKSIADDELSAHLASDSISQQESAYRPAYAQPMLAQSRVRPLTSAGQKPYYSIPRPSSAGQAQQYKQAPLRPIAPQLSTPSYAARPTQTSRLPPSYITLKGKLTGINSIISQYPHPAPGYPHQGPKHLPRGAAAGYAAFRDFVKAHASKYKSPLASATPALVTLHPPSTLAAPQLYNSQASYESPVPAAKDLAPQLAAAGNYKQAAAGEAYQEKQVAPSYKATSGSQTKTKVTIAQAYIPHPIKGPAQQSIDAYNSEAAGQYVNPILAKLYGGHAPQGAGKTEYNKDYGMVIHYPQATVYTEPMTVDQLHKLTGAGISQVLEQLQYNLANGYRDESNTIRANNKHHLGHGITIHAKEYYAPGKGGQYVPTTAAVISTAPNKYNPGESGLEQSYGDQSNSLGGDSPTSSIYATMLGQKAVELGSGYEKVKQAVANSQEKYNSKYGGAAQSGNGDYYQQQAAQAAPQQAEPSAYGEQPRAPASPKLIGSGEPLSAITNLLGSELESLYKANAALTKHIEPEIHQAITKATSGYGKSQALKYSELGQASPFTPHGVPFSPANNRPKYPQPAHSAHSSPRYPRYGPRGSRRGPHGGNRYPPQRGIGGPRYRGLNRPAGHYGLPRLQHVQRPYRQPQQQAYHAAEQALNQQMMQFLQDFQASDEQYGKNSPNTINQGYPYKIMQKYNQNQGQKYGQNQQQTGPQYHQQEGLELPQGSNDQIGEIADLIESLKGALDLSKPDGEDPYSSQKQGKSEEARYIASALGQGPSYALQVPVSNGESGYDASKKRGTEQAAYQAQPQQGAYQQPQLAAYQQAQQGAYQVPPQQAAFPQAQPAAYAQPQQSYAPTQPAEAGYQQAPQQPPQQQYEQAAQAGYQQAAGGAYGQRTQAGSGYGQQAQAYGQPQAAQQQQQPAAAYGASQQYGQQSSGDYQQPQPNSYEQQQQAAGPQQGSEYSAPIAAPALHAAAALGSTYGAAPSSVGSAGSYSLQASAGESALSQHAAAPATTISEHSSVINHLVPVQTQAQQPNQPYESSSSAAAAQAVPQQQAQQHPPAHQIAIAAPTESQYQQAQSISSFVDGLSSEYQELLRQPALLDDHSNVSHIAIPEVSSGYSGNATASAPASYDQQASASNKVVSGNQSLDQAYQQQARGQHRSASGSTRQYSAVKK